MRLNLAVRTENNKTMAPRYEGGYYDDYEPRGRGREPGRGRNRRHSPGERFREGARSSSSRGGRRGPPFRRPVGQVRGDSSRGRATRARAAPRGGLGPRTLSHNPNQPVSLPQRTSRRQIPQTRSYADVVRGGRPRTRPEGRGRAREQDDRESGSRRRQRQDARSRDRFIVRREASPNFKRAAKQCFQTIKVQHHLNNLRDRTAGSGHLLVADKVRDLAEFIKPALPSEDVLATLDDLAQTWGQDVTQALITHYADTLIALEQDMEATPYNRWPEAFEVALRWANRSLPKATHKTLSAAENRVADAHTGGRGTETYIPPPRSEAQAAHSSRRASTPEQNNNMFTKCTEKTRGTGRLHTQGRQVTRERTQMPSQRQQSVVLIPRQVERRDRVRLSQEQTVRAPAGTSDWCAPPVEEEDTEMISAGQPPVCRDVDVEGHSVDAPNFSKVPIRTHIGGLPILVGPIAQPPKEQRQVPPRRNSWSAGTKARTPVSVVQKLVAQFDASFSSEGSWQAEAIKNARAVEKSLAEASQGDETVQNRVRSRASSVREDAISVHSVDLFEEEGEVDAERQEGDEGDDEGSQDGRSHSINLHRRTHRKTRDWNVVARKNTLILGDSNLARLDSHDFDDLQIDSYPGGTFLSVKHIMMGASYTVPPQTVVLAFGINSRQNDTKATTVKQLQTALRETRRVFPSARVVVPMVNYSKYLPEEEQQNLSDLNTHIAKNCDFLDLLPYELFQTESDRIHWTRRTAKAMVHHWAQMLNSEAPL